MSNKILHFLIVFDQHNNELLEIDEFGTDERAALAAYDAKEDKHQGQGFIEIVLLGADSLDSVKAIHTNYFTDEVVKSEWLRSL